VDEGWNNEERKKLKKMEKKKKRRKGEHSQCVGEWSNVESHMYSSVLVLTNVESR
jgi:hypothetical protein